LWHIMKIYAAHGVHDFIICLGFKGYVIKEYFSNYFLHMSDVTFNMRENRMTVHNRKAEPWNVTLVDTGDASMTGGRLKRVADYLPDGQPFFLTYGDGVADIDIAASLAFHKAQGRLATMTAVYPPGRFGAAVLAGDAVQSFREKPAGDGARINGGFFVMEKAVIDLIDGDDTILEQAPLNRLAETGQLSAYTHDGFWQCMDTLRDKRLLEDLWTTGKAPWKLWA
jgi:glucose-1-phosphate cytidylyltransferase